MRYQEALQNFIDDRIDTIDRSESDYIPYTTTDDIDVLKEAINKAQRYDELMTPKVVIVDDSEYEKYGESDYKCPSCNSWLRPDIFMEKHCFNCGQALKWGEQ